MPEPLVGGVVLADVDGDGHQDILAGGQTAVWLLLGTGTGFGAPHVATDADGKPSFDELPLAAVDFNRDGATDYVLPRGVRMSIPAQGDGGAPRRATYVYEETRRATRWTTAAVGNLNGDDYVDIAAASDEQPDIDFLSGNAAGSFTAHTISTTASVSHLTVGDYDGDSIDDLAFAEGRGDRAEMAIAFGKSFGAPEAPRSFGRVDGIMEMIPLTFPPNPIAILYVLLESPVPDDPTRIDFALALLVGSGDRDVQAPLILGTSTPRHVAPPDVFLRWTSAAVFGGPLMEPGRVDLAAVGVGYQFAKETGQPLRPPHPVGLWYSRGRGPLRFDHAVEEFTLDALAGGFGRSDGLLLHAASEDVDRPSDGVIEIVTLSPDGPDGRDAALHVVRPRTQAITTVRLPGRVVTPTSQLGLVDVDGDGARDAVVLTGEGDARRVDVHFGDGKGGFTPVGVAVEPRTERDRAEVGGPPTGFAPVVTGGARVTATGRASVELAVCSARKIFTALLEPDRARFDTTVLAGRLSDATGIAAGDFDGDGVEDLAVADAGALRIVRQRGRIR